MAVVRPFQGIVYDPGHVALDRVVAPPYDVITPADRVRYYQQDPRNVVRLIAGEVKPTDHPGDNKYTRAAAFFDEWMRAGVLRRESAPGLYVYRQSFIDPLDGRRHERSGILGAVEIRPLGDGVLPHEHTRARPRADQTSLTQAVAANLSPVFVLFQDSGGNVREVATQVERASPDLTIQPDPSERHDVWRVTDPGRIRVIAQALAPSPLYIADGHHRYETALKYRDRQRQAHPEASSSAAFNFVLALLVDAADPELRILPTHRLLYGLEPFDSGQLEQQLIRRHGAHPIATSALVGELREPVARHRLGVVLAGGRGLLVECDRARVADPVEQLDVTVLHRVILEGELGLHEGVLEDERHLGYSRDPDFVIEEVTSGRAQAGFLLRPTAVADVLAVARAGSVMPQKSTYFFPKPLSGIVFNPLDPLIRIEAA